MEVKILAMAPSASRKTVMAESWPVCPFLKFVTICIILPRRIIGMLAACPYQSAAAGVTRGLRSAQATPELLCFYVLEDSQGLCVPA